MTSLARRCTLESVRMSLLRSGRRCLFPAHRLPSAWLAGVMSFVHWGIQDTMHHHHVPDSSGSSSRQAHWVQVWRAGLQLHEASPPPAQHFAAHDGAVTELAYHSSGRCSPLALPRTLLAAIVHPGGVVKDRLLWPLGEFLPESLWRLCLQHLLCTHADSRRLLHAQVPGLPAPCLNILLLHPAVSFMRSEVSPGIASSSLHNPQQQTASLSVPSLRAVSGLILPGS